ncbi:MAG: DNA translocase FtsK, partial [Bacteroidaceae bacterium]|nr:DNA translocase FtsK [Bacteroidaceae bacterium]
EVIQPQDHLFIPETPKEIAEENKDIEMEVITNEEELYNGEELGEYDPTLDLSHYKYPTFDLLNKYDNHERQVDMDEQNKNKNRIIETLEHYGIKISSIVATVGPTITLYEIIPEPGVRISKIKNLEDDIALSLAALGIRIIAPIPGKGTIGIEVPNKDPQMVPMQSIIASQKFQECKYDLPIALGKTITNEIFIADLCKMPHVLVAGATGQGKSVGLNAIITSLLYKKHPAQLKFVLVDPKKVEFNIYSTIEKHFLAKLPDAEEAIITDVTKVVQTLNSITKEMDNRYDLLKKAHTRNIKEYNAKFIARKLNPNNGHRYMPYIVVIVDEFGDLIMTAGKEVELPIARIAQLARAVGIHMIIATQRPSTNIITGVIKANFPARVAFRVSSMIDSRTILDCPGANQLIGRGDLLFSQGSDLIRVQCAFVDTPEVEEVCNYIGQQTAYPTAYLLPEYVGESGEGDSIGAVDLKERDPMFEEAARLIVANQQGSTSLIQRKFSIGYNRAGRIMDQLEAAGIVGPFEGSKARQVLVIDDIHLDSILENLR